MTHCLRFSNPILFRDGRPYAAETGASSMAWPWPSTIYGALRTHIGRSDDQTWNDMTAGLPSFGGAVADIVGSRSQLGTLRIRGPLLLARPETMSRGTVAVPAPLDCDLFEANHDLVAVAAVPVAGEASSARLGGQSARLTWLAARRPMEAFGKPLRGPRYSWWPWHVMETWLAQRALAPAGSLQSWTEETTCSLPLRVRRESASVVLDTRVHVTIASAAGSVGPSYLRHASEGDLFVTERVELSNLKEAEMALWIDGDRGACGSGYLTLGGDRGIAHLTTDQAAPPELPTAVAEAVERTGALSLRLLTPALFKSGWAPAWLGAEGGVVRGKLPGADGQPTNVAVRLMAACVDRPLAVSGFEFGSGARGRERPARRAAPAGTVYFLQAEDGVDREALVEAVRKLWWHNVSDAADDRAMGFGLAVIGVGLPELEASA